MTTPRKPTTRLYYGQVIVSHYDQGTTAEIATVVSRALAKAGIDVRVDALWIEHVDGTDKPDATWDGTQWISPIPRKPRK